MGILAYVSDFFFIDVESATKILFLGNLFFCALCAVYRSSGMDTTSSVGLRRFMVAKCVQALGHLLMILSWNLSHGLFAVGILAICIGIFVESLVLIAMSHNARDWVYIVQSLLFAVILVGMLVSFFGDLPKPLKISITSSAFVLMLILPGTLFLYGSEKTALRKLIGSLYLAVLVISLFRVAEGLVYHDNLMRFDFLFQNILFLIQILTMLIGSTGMLLLSKEDADRHIRDLAYFDHLTGLLNRRHFMEEAEVFFAHHARYKESLAAVFLDLDYFKNVNDTYGHPFGDVVLKDFSTLLRRSVRGSDLCCRYGGEEFVIFLSNTNAERAECVCRRILTAVPLSRFYAQPDFRYTVSIGLYVTVPGPGNGDTIQSCVEKADQALYRAKTLGRDRIEVWSPEQA
jgi:diguanylate cyclase (GGDEF)-like protein